MRLQWSGACSYAPCQCNTNLAGDRKIQNRYRGHVKWFNAAKGFGFVVTDDPGPDILIHMSVLRNFGQSGVEEGAAIELIAQGSPRGLQTTEVISISPPESSSTRRESAPHNIPNTAGDGATSSLLPARIKWFDKLRGFGFANVFGSSDDVFVHMEVLRQCGITDLQSGEAVAVKIRQGPRGTMVSEIRPWEAAQKGSARGDRGTRQQTDSELDGDDGAE